MSCWVVPTVAADYWGVTLDVVWHRIGKGVVPHKTEQGFVFIDLDPWTADIHGITHHEPPCTYVPAGEEQSLDDSIADDSITNESHLTYTDPAVSEFSEPQPFDSEIESGEAALLYADPWDATPRQDLMSEDEEPQPVFAGAAEDEMDQEGEEKAPPPDDELPALDEEETATFGRLSWTDVRSRVGRSRRPPPSRRD